MADLGITGLKTEVDVQIYTNHAQAITGAIMNDTLIDTIDTLKNGGNLDAKSVDTAQLADNAVEALQINAGAVTEAKIGAKAVTNAKIGNKAVDTAQLADGAVEALQIATGAVETAKIKDLNVTTSKLAAKAVTREKLADDAMASIAPEWVANTPYAWYDFVMHNNLLYMCISPNSDATWIGDHWLVENVGKVLTSNYQDYEDISSLLSDTAVALDTTVDNFAIPWTSNSSYAVGKLVIREYKLYRCKTANNDSVWTASKWVRTSIEEETSSQLFTGAVLLNPFNAIPSLVPRRVGDIALNTSTFEIWQSTSVANAAASWNLQASASYVEAIKEDVDSINVDNLGDARAKSIDMDELPKVCSFPMYIISTTAPNVVPDFVSQHWIDTVAKKVYVAVGVSSSADFVALN